MFGRSWNRLALVAGTAATLLAAATSTAASADSLCPNGRIPAFQSPDVTLTPITGYFQVWGTDATVFAFCEDLSNPGDHSMPLANIAVTGVSLVRTDAVPDLQISISTDGNGAFMNNIPDVFPGVVVPISGLATDSSGNATFVIKAQSASTPILGGPNGTAQLVGLNLEFSTGPVGQPGQFIMSKDYGEVFAQTPELDSLFLFGSGALGIAGYGMLRFRARRKA